MKDVARDSEDADGRARRAAGLLVASRIGGAQLDCLPPESRPQSVHEGYLAQGITQPLLENSGFGRQGGWKIGCTTLVMQEYLGIGDPTAGAMFHSSMWNHDHRFLLSPPNLLGVECELAVRLGRDLIADDREYSVEEMVDAIAAVMASIEVVEDRYVDYRSLDTPTLVADGFFHYGCVLGAQNETFDPRMLRDVTASMSINGSLAGEGIGADILGEPLLVLAWLAKHCAVYGTPLRAGDIVTLGSLVQTQWVSPGDLVEVHNEMLGDVSASFDVVPTRDDESSS
jgi:2-keto-4-pentenoate hydratase